MQERLEMKLCTQKSITKGRPNKLSDLDTYTFFFSFNAQIILDLQKHMEQMRNTSRLLPGYTW